jgi:hypothetical protein
VISCIAKEKESDTLIQVENSASGPFGGDRDESCLKIYYDGRLVYSHYDKSGIGMQDQSGKVTHRQTKTTHEYRFPETDSWQISELQEFVSSKAAHGLKSYYKSPHHPVDYYEASNVRIFLPDGNSKQIRVMEYYVASLEEKVKYPSALIILMDILEHIEEVAGTKGTAIEPFSACSAEQNARIAASEKEETKN